MGGTCCAGDGQGVCAVSGAQSTGCRARTTGRPGQPWGRPGHGDRTAPVALSARGQGGAAVGARSRSGAPALQHRVDKQADGRCRRDKEPSVQRGRPPTLTQAARGSHAQDGAALGREPRYLSRPRGPPARLGRSRALCAVPPAVLRGLGEVCRNSSRVALPDPSSLALSVSMLVATPALATGKAASATEPQTPALAWPGCRAAPGAQASAGGRFPQRNGLWPGPGRPRRSLW